jgi:hypothetical protein
MKLATRLVFFYIFTLASLLISAEEFRDISVIPLRLSEGIDSREGRESRVPPS